MTRVYGGCIEPGGMELQDERVTMNCPKCGHEAIARYWEQADGGCINLCSATYCLSCDYAEGDTQYGPA